MTGAGFVAVPAWVLPVLIAPFIGSFLGVLIVRLPTGTPLVLARSSCDHCVHRLAVTDLVPLVSYVWTRGRCRYCAAPIGAFHPGVELVALGIAVWAALASADGFWLWASCGLGWGLLTLAWIDARHMTLPDVLTWPLVLAGLTAVAIGAPDALLEHVAAAVAGGGAFVLVAIVYRKVRDRDGLGLGDAKLLAAGGAWVGLAALPWIVVLAAGGGLLFAAWRQLRGEPAGRTVALPFGPFLAGAIWLVFLYKPMFLG